EDKKPGVTEVTVEELYKAPEKYDGKLVRVEGVLNTDPRERVYMGKTRYRLSLDALYVWCPGKPEFKAGDRVLVTGQFDFKAPSFMRLAINADVEGGKVERAPEKKEE